MESYSHILSNVATDALVLKQQSINTHSAGQISNALKWVQDKIIAFISNKIRK